MKKKKIKNRQGRVNRGHRSTCLRELGDIGGKLGIIRRIVSIQSSIVGDILSESRAIAALVECWGHFIVGHKKSPRQDHGGSGLAADSLDDLQVANRLGYFLDAHSA